MFFRNFSWVGTDSAYRNQGFSSDLIKTAVNWIEKHEDFD
ncbi:hypothetical protein TMUPMC115_2279 [Tetragenococcus muriaticus PMC-11-5]|uniref:Uncharacterized protein n=2 Tax=Tetragenococcus muriaticus TaxID=64642 RepID=A0A091C543_9ENTE|nr:hypothetical protein TMUPMC115_2279 [Tetragenococcus muriaticus PMC-11-5]KFN91800.1 hypothetical protein TMU3MR103_0860 [Tetragenococcus muriaticus 3MR10-3]